MKLQLVQMIMLTSAMLNNAMPAIIIPPVLFVSGCYGVDGESDSIMSSASENSTEPWFCDACKNGVTPSCELCPNQDGIFKETDAGRWAWHHCVYPGFPLLPFYKTQRLESVEKQIQLLTFCSG